MQFNQTRPNSIQFNLKTEFQNRIKLVNTIITTIIALIALSSKLESSFLSTERVQFDEIELIIWME